jgi:hypothetical protein
MTNVEATFLEVMTLRNKELLLVYCQRNEQNAWRKFIPLLYMRIFRLEYDSI